MTAASLLGWCASRADLPRACADLSAFLALRRRRTEVVDEPLLGLWVDPSWGERIPSELQWRDPDGTYSGASIRESAGVEGIWMLCWLEAPASARPMTRHALLASLAALDAAVADRPPVFVPVFPLDAPANEVRVEWQRLKSEHAQRLLAPLSSTPSSCSSCSAWPPGCCAPSCGCRRRFMNW
jgi:hypothetical protein